MDYKKAVLSTSNSDKNPISRSSFCRLRSGYTLISTAKIHPPNFIARQKHIFVKNNKFFIHPLKSQNQTYISQIRSVSRTAPRSKTNIVFHRTLACYNAPIFLKPERIILSNHSAPCRIKNICKLTLINRRKTYRCFMQAA